MSSSALPSRSAGFYKLCEFYRLPALEGGCTAYQNMGTAWIQDVSHFAGSSLQMQLFSE